MNKDMDPEGQTYVVWQGRWDKLLQEAPLIPNTILLKPVVAGGTRELLKHHQLSGPEGFNTIINDLLSEAMMDLGIDPLAVTLEETQGPRVVSTDEELMEENTTALEWLKELKEEVQE